jgi:hypothetical protein
MLPIGSLEIHTAQVRIALMRDTEIFSLRGEAHHPWHLYAGVVLLNEEGKLPLVLDTEGVYGLPKDTLASDENVIAAAHRIILAQVQVVPQVSGYLGSVTTRYVRYDDSSIEKTVLYFEARFTTPFGGLKDKGKELIWLTLDDAYDLLAKEHNGEEALIDRIRVGSALPIS